MSWAISRIRLSQIGPATARYEGILDLRDATGAPAQAVALRLVNQGGKGVLLQHLLNVLVPGQRGIIGEKETWTKLGKFVLGGDLAHLAIEWRRADELLITGKTMRWSHGHPSSDSRELLIHFYSFRPDGLTLDTLPFVRDGRRLTHAVFHKVLADALTEHARGDHNAVHTTDRGNWIAALRARGIDSDLFRYQVRMNHQEGGADQLLTSLKTDDAFLRFAVEILADEDDLKQLTAMVAAQRTALARRDLVAGEASVCQALADAGKPLLGLADDEHAARQTLAHALRDAQLLWLALDRTRATAEEHVPRLEQRRREATTDMTTARREQVTARLQVADARAQAAALDLADAERHVADRSAAVTLRDRTWKAWKAIGPLADVAQAEARLHAIATAEEQLSRDSAPLRRLAGQAGQQLHAALTLAICSFEARIAAAEHRAAQAQEREQDERRRADDAHQAAAALRQRLDHARTQRSLLDRARDRLVRDGTLPAGVHASDHLPAVSEQRDDATATLRDLRARVDAAERHATAMTRARNSVAQAVAGAQAETTRAREHLDALEGEIKAVISLPGLSTALEQDDDVIALWNDPRHAAARLGEHEQHAQLRLAGQLAEEHAQRDIVERIAADVPGLIPPDDDCRQVLDHLLARKLAVASGWRYVHESRAPDEWRDTLRRAGPLAASVVLTASDTPTADLLAAELNLQLPGLRRAVPVLTSDEFEALVSTSASALPARRVVSAAAGLVDPAAAERHRTELEDTLATAEEMRTELERAVRHATSLRLACVALWERHPADPRPTAHAQLADTEGELARVLQQLRAAVDADTRATDALAALRDRITAADTLQRRLDLEIARLEPIAATEQRLAGAEHDPTAIDALLVAQYELRDRALVDEANGRQARSEAESERRTLRDDRQARITERARITAPTEELPAADEQPPELQHARSTYDAALERWHAASTDEQLVADRQRTEADLADAQQQRDAFDADVLAAAAELLSTGRADMERRHDAEEHAHQQLSDAQKALGAAEAVRDDAVSARDHAAAAQTTVDQELATAGQRRTLDEDERSVFAAAGDARTAAQAAAQREADADRRRNRAASQEAGLRDQIRAAQQRATTCRRMLGRLPNHPDPEASAPPLADDLDDLDLLVDEAAAALDQASADLGAVHQQQAEIAKRLRLIALDENPPAEAARQLRATIVAHGEHLELAAWATTAQPRIEARAASSAQELAHLDQRTHGVVDFYAQLTARFTGLLRRLASVSKMPDGLGGWSRRSFIAASLPAKPTDAALRDRVDRTLKAALDSDQESRLRGPDLLVRAIVAACDGRAPTIRFLKPDIGLPYQPVALGEGMSGGQGVTAAVALYCALANLRREAVAAQLTATGGGTLLLDNPFGKATSPELLGIMFRVAERLGVQLVCLTPSTEDAVVAQFPVLLQLRNSRGVRDGLRHVRVQDVRYRDALGQHTDDISAVRLTREDP